MAGHIIIFRREDDETLEILIDEETLGTFTHDDLGWSEMSAIEKLVSIIAKKLNVPILTEES